jgi:hypothetical protein
MMPEPASGDGEVKTGPVFVRAPAGLQERTVDKFDVDAAVLDGLDRIRDLDQFARGSFGISEGRLAAYFIRSFH